MGNARVKWFRASPNVRAVTGQPLPNYVTEKGKGVWIPRPQWANCLLRFGLETDTSIEFGRSLTCMSHVLVHLQIPLLVKLETELDLSLIGETWG